jgi:tetratricopeptide (TPR) repeat protein
VIFAIAGRALLWFAWRTLILKRLGGRESEDDRRSSRARRNAGQRRFAGAAAAGAPKLGRHARCGDYRCGRAAHRAYNDRGIAYQALGNFDAASRDFTESVDVEPNALGYENRAYIHLRRNRFDDAIADATTSIRLNPKRARTYWIRSGAYEEKEKGQWTEAIADATTCIGLDPTFSDCLDRRGYAYSKLDKSDLALADYDESLRLAPRSTWTLVARGNLRKDKQLLDLALSDFSETIRLDPKNVDAYANRGDVYYMKDQYPLAIADATKAIEINSGTSYTFAVRGFSLFDAGRLDEARSDLATAVQRYPKWVKPRYWYAVTEAKLEEKMYESCPKGGNRRPNANTMVGGLPICMTGLEFGTSMRELAEVIRLNPEAFQCLRVPRLSVHQAAAT